MLAAKNASVKSLTSGIESFLFKKNGVDYIKGEGSFASPTQLNVKLTEGGETQIEAKNIIIATGSEVTPFPGIEIDEKRVVSSTGALDLQEVPKKVSLGGIYRKWSLMASSSSSEVVLSVLSLVPFGADSDPMSLLSSTSVPSELVWMRKSGESRRLPLGTILTISKQFQRILQKQGFKFKLNTKVVGADVSGEMVKLNVEAAKGGKEETVSHLDCKPPRNAYVTA